MMRQLIFPRRCGMPTFGVGASPVQTLVTSLACAAVSAVRSFVGFVCYVMASVGATAADPTTPLRLEPANQADTREGQLASLNLECIIYGAVNRVAIINGQRVRVTHKVGEYEVARIDRDAVVLDSASGEVVLQLRKAKIERTGTYADYRK